MEKNCLNCIWFNKDKMHCDYEFGTSRYKPDFLDDDNNFIDENNKLIEDINVLEDFRCKKYCERISIPKTEFRPLDLMEDYKNIVDKIKEHIKTELEKRYDDIKFSDFHFLCFSIKDIVFDLLLLNNFIDIHYYADFRCGNDKLETFEELFKYIDDVISEED